MNDPATRGEKFIVSLDRVAVKEEEVRGVMLCVQDSVRRPHFTQRSFFPDSGSTMLSESVVFADSLTSSPGSAPRCIVETACASQVITDMRVCWNRVFLRLHTAKDISERWYHGGTPRSEIASKPGVKFLDVVEDGRAEYMQFFACS